MLLVHTLAHVAVDDADLSDDSSPLFQAQLYSSMRNVAAELFQREQRSRAKAKDAVAAATVTATAAANPAAGGGVLASLAPPKRIALAATSSESNLGGGGSMVDRVSQYAAFASNGGVRGFLASLEGLEGMAAPDELVDEAAESTPPTASVTHQVDEPSLASGGSTSGARLEASLSQHVSMLEHEVCTLFYNSKSQRQLQHY